MQKSIKHGVTSSGRKYWGETSADFKSLVHSDVPICHASYSYTILYWLPYTQLELCLITWTRKIPKCSQTLWETWNALPQSHLRKLQTNVLQWIASKGPHKTLARFKTWFISFIWCFYISVMFKQLYTHFLGGIYMYMYMCWGKCCSPRWPYVFMCSSLCWSLIQITRWLRLFEKPNRRRMALQRWRPKQRKSISRRQ